MLLAFGGGMAYAFRTLRPLFRERGKINAEVTGRLTEALGGIRVVKSYTAEKREEIVFTKGAHRLFRNIAKSMTGVSATTAGSTVIVGIIGVLMIWLGGRAILAGEMTLGDLDHVHLLHRPGRGAARVDCLDRHADHRSVRRARSHPRDPRHADRAGRGRERARRSSGSRGDVAFEDVWFEYNEGQPVLRGVSFQAAAGTTTALVGSSGSGKSTLISLVMAFNRPTQGPGARSTARTWRTCGSMDYREQLASVLQENFLFDGTIAENVGYAQAGRHARRDQGGLPHRALRRVHQPVPAGLRHHRRRARASSCRAASASACRSRARFWPTRAS